MEQSASRCHFVAIAADIQEMAEDGTVCSELPVAPAASDILLFTARAARTSFRFCLFCFVRCPSSLYIIYINQLRSIINNNNNNNNMLNSSGLTACVRDHPSFTVFRMKSEQNLYVTDKFNAILGVLTIYTN